MSTRFRGLVPRGVVAGVIGATALAFWFLVVDGSQGQPFRTPGFLGGALLGTDPLDPGPGPVILFTLLHYVAFICVGLGVSWSLPKIQTIPNMFLGLVLGFGLFDLVYYTSVTVTGVDVIGEFGWPAVLVGNLIGGVSLMSFLSVTSATTPIPWWTIFGESKVFKGGLIAGLVGAGTIALWFLIIDMGRGQPFFTPGALGSALFLGSSDPSAVNVSLATVAGYSILHIGAFFATGFIAAAIAGYAEDTPSAYHRCRDALRGLRGVLHGTDGAFGRVSTQRLGLVGDRRGERSSHLVHGILSVGQAPEIAGGARGQSYGQDGLSGKPPVQGRGS